MRTFRCGLVMVATACSVLASGGMGFGQQTKAPTGSAPEPEETMREQLENMVFGSQEARDMFDELSSLDVGKLIRLKVLPDPCARKEWLKCGSVTGDEVRPLIDLAMVAQKEEKAEKQAAVQAALSAEQNRYSRLFALGGLCISCLSLLLSALSYRQRARAATA